VRLLLFPRLYKPSTTKKAALSEATLIKHLWIRKKESIGQGAGQARCQPPLRNYQGETAVRFLAALLLVFFLAFLVFFFFAKTKLTVILLFYKPNKTCLCDKFECLRAIHRHY
jgi:hypothetical protein